MAQPGFLCARPGAGGGPELPDADIRGTGPLKSKGGMASLGKRLRAPNVFLALLRVPEVSGLHQLLGEDLLATTEVG